MAVAEGPLFFGILCAAWADEAILPYSLCLPATPPFLFVAFLTLPLVTGNNS